MIDFYISILNKLPVWLLLCFSAMGVVMGDYFAKAWSINHKTLFLVAGFIGYFVSSFFYIPTLLREGLVVTSVVWSLLGIIGFLFIGLAVFHETLTTLQILGVVIGLIALIVLTLATA